MEKADLIELLDAMDWARERMLGALEPLTAAQWRRPLGGSFGDLHQTLLHMLGAERIWTGRLLAHSTEESPQRRPAAALAGGEELPDLASLRQAWTAVAHELRDWLLAQPPEIVRAVIRYKNTKGVEQTTPVANVLLQLSHHQAYHRGQVTHMVRQLGQPAVQTDYIAFWRERQAGTAKK